MADALPRLAARPDAFRFSLVTGNFERIARLKLARAGIGDWFPEGQGAFGSDAEDRELLPPIARARAGDWPRERTVVIGDTPRDIACARADGLRVIAVATGPFAVEALADADAVADSARSRSFRCSRTGSREPPLTCARAGDARGSSTSSRRRSACGAGSRRRSSGRAPSSTACR